jgi:hypothetical protein
LGGVKLFGMGAKVEIVKLLERHKVNTKRGEALQLVHAMVRIKTDDEVYVRLFVPLSLVLQEGKEYSILVNGLTLRVKEDDGLGVPFPFGIPKPSLP